LSIKRKIKNLKKIGNREKGKIENIDENRKKNKKIAKKSKKIEKNHTPFY